MPALSQFCFGLKPRCNFNSFVVYVVLRIKPQALSTLPLIYTPSFLHQLQRQRM